MEARYAFRKSQLLDECQITPEIFEQVIPRLYTFMKPFVKSFQGQAAEQHAKTYVCGLLSDVERKNIESIAYRLGQSRLPLQGFIGWDAWDDEPLRHVLIGQVKTHLGQADGVLVFDPSGFPKSGRESVGVARQWCGRLGKVDTCQVAIYLGYVSRKGHTLVATRLYLPKEWTQDKARLDKAGVPNARRGYRTRHQLALEMLAAHGASLPHRWIAGDDEMGRPSWFRRRLAALGEHYLLAVPSNTAIRDLETPPPASPGKGRCPQRPWQSVEVWSQSLDAAAWRRIDVRDGSKGPLVVEVVKRRVVSRTHRRQQGDEELLAVMRYRDRDQDEVVKVDYYLSNAVPETPLWELARVAKAEHRIEECLQRGKSEAGLADYEVRHWTGWQHHQTLSLLATWFLVRETQRGKKLDACHNTTADSPGHCGDLARGVSVRHDVADVGRTPEALAAQ
jgi:SRSO17 transposase